MTNPLSSRPAAHWNPAGLDLIMKEGPETLLDLQRIQLLEIELGESFRDRILSMTETRDHVSYLVRAADGTGDMVMVRKDFVDGLVRAHMPRLQ